MQGSDAMRSLYRMGIGSGGGYSGWWEAAGIRVLVNISVHHTGSAGNLYRINDILLEAGVPIRVIKEALNFRLSGVRACLVSHSHMDHAKSAKDIMRAGIDLYCSRETAEALGLKGHRLHIVEAGTQVDIGPWMIMPFNLVHDVPNLGFLLAKGNERVLYATDTNYIPNRFQNLTHIMLGVGYDSEVLKDNIMQGIIDSSLGKRILKNHMSLQTALGFFRANDMSKVEEIHLLHLSNTNSNDEKFRREVEKATGRPVYIKEPHDRN